MTRMLILAVLFLSGVSSVGCRNADVDTPRTLRGTEAPDQPHLSIDEQERRGRARYGMHEDDFRVGPRTYTDRPDPVGGGANKVRN